jgi:hypothetical protein
VASASLAQFAFPSPQQHSALHKMTAAFKISLPNGLNYDQPTGLFIDNEYVPANGEKFTVYNPT